MKAALQAAREKGGTAWLKTQLSSTECDLLAISKNGELLTVEIKPEKVAAAALAPLQAWQYAQQFRAWTSDCADPGGVLLGMYAQRRSLGLSVNPEEPQLTYPLSVHPAIAIGAGANETIHKRLRRVVRLLREAELDDPPMRFYTVNLVGRLDEFDPLP